MKSYILNILFALSFSGISFADDMDGNPEAAPPAGEFINESPMKKKACKVMEETWKNQYIKIQNLQKKSGYVPDEKENDLDDTTNSLMSMGCIQSTDKLKQEAEEEILKQGQ